MKNEKTHVAVYRRVDAEDTEQETSNRLLASADERRINTHPSWLYAGTYIDSGMERTAFSERYNIQHCKHKLNFRPLRYFYHT